MFKALGNTAKYSHCGGFALLRRSHGGHIHYFNTSKNMLRDAFSFLRQSQNGAGDNALIQFEKALNMIKTKEYFADNDLQTANILMKIK